MKIVFALLASLVAVQAVQVDQKLGTDFVTEEVRFNKYGTVQVAKSQLEALKNRVANLE